MKRRTGRPWPCQQQPGGCRCQCHAIARAKAERDRAGQWDDWQPEHDAILRERIRAGATIEQIIDTIDASHKIRRSPDAVRARLTLLGESLRTGWRSQNEVAAALGVHTKEVVRWRTMGLLPATRHGGSHWLRIMDVDLEAFVRTAAGVLFHPSGVVDRHLHALAEVSARVNMGRSA